MQFGINNAEVSDNSNININIKSNDESHVKHSALSIAQRSMSSSSAMMQGC
jgi:hypothetical protein